MKRKKKGSSLLVTVCMFAILSIIIMSILAMTTAGFKLRKDESKRIENFYGADSGIEIAYAEIQNVIKSAVEISNKAVKDAENGTLDNYPDGTKIDKKIKEWRDKLFKDTYKKYIEDNIKNAIDNDTGTSKIYESYKRDGKEIKVKAEIKVKQGNSDIYICKLISKFKDKEEKEREIEVEYEIEVPKYGVTFAKGIKSNLTDYVIATDGNLIIENKGDLDIYGDIWINGKEDNGDKFSRGITINSQERDGQAIDWNGKVITRGALNIHNSNVNFYDEIYSRDLKITGANSIDLKSNDIYVYNDFIFNSDTTKIKMGNYYGLNDINYYENNIESNTNLSVNALDRSSSIIINSNGLKEGGNSLIEGNDMYIAGTSYLGGRNELDPLQDYQSGESIVINRNTKPYTDRNLEGNYLYEYKNPLHIVDEIYVENKYRELKLPEKVTLVEKFYGIYKGEEDFIQNPRIEEATNIKFKNIYSSGVAYANGTAYSHTPILDLENQQKKYVEEVFLRRVSKANLPEDFWEKSEEMSVGGSINWDKITQLMSMGKIYKTETGNGDDSKNSVLFEKDSQSDTQTVIFRGNETIYSQIDWIFKDEIDKGETITEKNQIKEKIVQKLGGVTAKKLVLIFDKSNKELVLNNKNANLDKEKKYIEYSDYEIPVVISNSDIEVKVNTSNIMVLTEGNLKVVGNGTFGNFVVNPELLKYMIGKLFDLKAFEGIVSGENQENLGEEESTTLIEVSDLIKQKQWKLIK